MQLGAVGWSSLKKQIVSPPSLPSQNVDCCGPLSNAKSSREGKRSMKNFSLFIARDSISFCFFARSVTSSLLPSLTSMLELAHSIKVPQSIFQEIENERCFIRNAGSDTSLLFNFKWMNTYLLKFKISQNTVFENHKKSLIQHCERSELSLHFEWTKVN